MQLIRRGFLSKAAGGTVAGTTIFSGTVQASTTPSAGNDITNKAYVDVAIAGLSIANQKTSVAAASTTDITIATASTGSIDGVTLSVGNRVLLKDQTATEENGIYVVGAAGAWARSTDLDETSEAIADVWVIVGDGGTANGNTGWYISTAPATIDVDPMVWTKFTDSTSGAVVGTNYLYKPGVSGGQIAYGGTDASDDLELYSTANATKGDVIIHDRAVFNNGGLINRSGSIGVFSISETVTSSGNVFEYPHIGTGSFLNIDNSTTAMTNSSQIIKHTHKKFDAYGDFIYKQNQRTAGGTFVMHDFKCTSSGAQMFLDGENWCSNSAWNFIKIVSKATEGSSIFLQSAIGTGSLNPLFKATTTADQSCIYLSGTGNSTKAALSIETIGSGNLRGIKITDSPGSTARITNWLELESKYTSGDLIKATRNKSQNSNGSYDMFSIVDNFNPTGSFSSTGFVFDIDLTHTVSGSSVYKYGVIDADINGSTEDAFKINMDANCTGDVIDIVNSGTGSYAKFNNGTNDIFNFTKAGNLAIRCGNDNGIDLSDGTNTLALFRKNGGGDDGLMYLYDGNAAKIVLRGSGVNRIDNGSPFRVVDGVYIGASSSAFLLDDAAGAASHGTIYLGNYEVVTQAPSDRMLKKDIKDSDLGLETINNISVKSFKFEDEFESANIVHYGVIAQELETVLPNLVRQPNFEEIDIEVEMADGTKATRKKNRGVPYKSVDYIGLIPILIKAIQDLSAEVDALKS